MSLPWITNRLPTRADADENGRVVALWVGVKIFEATRFEAWSTIPWSNVEKFQPWLKFEPASNPLNGKPRPYKCFCGSPETDHSVETRYAVAEDGTAWYKKGNGPWQQETPLPECAKLTNPNQDKHE